MPIYEYLCRGCDQVFELRVRVEDRHAVVECEWCGELMDRQLPRPGVYEPTNTQIRFDNKLAKNREKADESGW